MAKIVIKYIKNITIVKVIRQLPRKIFKYVFCTKLRKTK